MQIHTEEHIHLSIEATEAYENTRAKIAKFINAKHREEIIFSKNATESIKFNCIFIWIRQPKKRR